jgi:hypothetical protein
MAVLAVGPVPFEPVTLLALVVLGVAVVTAVVPGVPTGLVSLAGVGLYWWGTGFAEPGTLALAALVVLCLLMVLADWLGELVAARVGGASTLTTVVAGAVGLVLLVFTGPVGMLLGAATVVFVLEFRRQGRAGAGLRAAGAFVAGFFASAAIQALLALLVFAGTLWVALG